MIIPQDRPAYRILSPNGFFGPDDHLYVEGDCIVFEDEPNEDMEPLNDVAREKLKVYLQKLDDLGREAAAKAGRAYAGRARSLDEALATAREDARRIQLVEGDGGRPLMGAKKRGRPRVERIEKDEPPQDGRKPRGGGGALAVG